MSWFGSLFSHDAPAPHPVAAPAEAPFAARLLASLDSLAREERRASAAVSPRVFSMLRGIDDILRPLLAHVAQHPVAVEREVAIESLITDYVPAALSLYLQLPAAQHVDGGRADLLLQEQYASLEKSALRLATLVYEDSVSALETQALFIQTKFNR